MSVIGRSAARLSAWVDASYPAGMDPELVLRRRVDKVNVEAGEVGQALEGYTGENPRKGVFDTREHVMKELLDVASAALNAWEHMDGNRGRSGAALEAHFDFALNRVGIGAEPGHMMRGYAFAATDDTSTPVTLGERLVDRPRIDLPAFPVPWRWGAGALALIVAAFTVWAVIAP